MPDENSSHGMINGNSSCSLDMIHNSSCTALTTIALPRNGRHRQAFLDQMEHHDGQKMYCLRIDTNKVNANTK